MYPFENLVKSLELSTQKKIDDHAHTHILSGEPMIP